MTKTSELKRRNDYIGVILYSEFCDLMRLQYPEVLIFLSSSDENTPIFRVKFYEDTKGFHELTLSISAKECNYMFANNADTEFRAEIIQRLARCVSECIKN